MIVRNFQNLSIENVQVLEKNALPSICMEIKLRSFISVATSILFVFVHMCNVYIRD